MKRFSATVGASILVAIVPLPASAAHRAARTAVPRAAALGPGAFVWNDTGPTQPVSIVISIPDQKAYVYRGETLIGAASVSTGKGGKDTPTGTFTILQKEAVHHSNVYNSAPMPFMQRLTQDGVAIHAGRNPGFPASHGCIRVPRAFAEKLFAVTTLGTPVLVADVSARDGLVPPEPYDSVAMEAATHDANAAQLNAMLADRDR